MSEDNPKYKKLLADLEAHTRILGLSDSKNQIGRASQMLDIISKLRNLIQDEGDQKLQENQYSTTLQTHALAYMSTSNVPENQITQELENILRIAMERNADLGITGYLVYRSGYFIQWVEGHKENLELLYGRISLDPRHGRLRLLFRGPIENRYFPHWGMEYSISSEKEDQVLKEGLIRNLEKDSNQLSPEQLVSLINFLKTCARNELTGYNCSLGILHLFFRSIDFLLSIFSIQSLVSS